MVMENSNSEASSKSFLKPLNINYTNKTADVILQYLNGSLIDGDDKTTDVMIHCKDGLVLTHKLVLASISKMLYSIFKLDSWDESISLIMPDFNIEEIKGYLEDLYKCTDINGYLSINETFQLRKCLNIKSEFKMEIPNYSDTEKESKAKVKGIAMKEEKCEKVIIPVDVPKIEESEDDGDNDYDPGNSEDSEEEPHYSKRIKLDRKYEDGKLVRLKTKLKNGKASLRSPFREYYEYANGKSKCKLCGRIGEDRINLLGAHLKFKHPDVYVNIEKGSKNNRFKPPKVLKQYFQEIDSDPSKVICSVCQKYITSNNINRHLKNIHKITAEGQTIAEWLCSYCGKIYNDKWSRDMHEITIHTKEYPYVCSECGKGFAISTMYHSHMKMHQGVKDFMCNACGKQFMARGALNAHYCEGSGEQKPFQCGDCGIYFSYKSLLKNHERTCNLFSNCRDAVKNLTCTKCNIKFSNFQKMKQHCLQSTTCTLLERKPFQCEVCKKFFTTEIRLNIHMRVHTGETPYQCNLCFKKFKFQHRLHNHKCLTSSNLNPVQG